MNRKVYILKDEDFDMLRADMERDPARVRPGMSEEEKRAYYDLWRLMNYRVTGWIDRMRGD